MKKIIIILIIMAAIIEGCKKYEDGPWISLRSAKHRLYGSYKLITYKVNGIDSLSLYNDSLGLIFSFMYDDVNSIDKCFIDRLRKNGLWTQLIWEWKMIDNYKTLKIELAYGSTQGTGPFGKNKTPQWEILRLTNKEVKMKTNYIGKEYFIELER